MSLSTILTIIALCALAAAASSNSITNFKLSEMDPFSPEAYDTVYAQHLRPHGARSAFSTAPAAMRTGVSTASTMTAGERAETLVIGLMSQIFWALFRWSLYIALLWSILRFVPWGCLLLALGEWIGATAQEIAPQIRVGLRGWLDLFILLSVHIFRAVTQNQLVVHARWAFGDWLFRTRQAVDHLIDDIRHHQLRHLIYLHYQLIVNRIGRHKLHMIVFIVGIHFLSTATRAPTRQTTEIFVEWRDLHKYNDVPIPGCLFRQRLEDGSNCHYHPGRGEAISDTTTASRLLEEATTPFARDGETEIEQEETGLLGRISDTPTTTPPPEEASAPRNQVRETESEQAGPGWVESISALLTPAMLLEEASLLSTEVLDTEKRQKLPGETVAFCKHCRQAHCCEVYI